MANIIDTSEFTPATPVAADLGPIMTLGGAQSVGTITAGPFKNFQCHGIKVVVNLTAVSGTSPTLVVNINGFDPASQTSYVLLASATLNANGQTVMTVYPSMAVVANKVASDLLPENWSISATFGGTSPSFTGTISACLLP